jgi:N-carbamoyl-L-amino-acid hydrolase
MTTISYASPRRMLDRLKALGEIGATGDGGVCRLALSDADRAGRDLVVGWMRALDLEILIDAFGNIFGRYPKANDAPAVVMGSHIDTVATGGIYDGNLGVLAGLEVIETAIEQKLPIARPLIVAVFTNEEGVRFAPQMMGSLVFAGGLPIQTALDTIGIDGARLGDELRRIGYDGDYPVGKLPIHSFLELHIEQGPVLETEDVTIGAVDRVQGISWTEYKVLGQSSHAGTTPMHLRKDAGRVACEIGAFVPQMVFEMGGDQVGTVGRMILGPNLTNVVAREATLTVDLRNTDAGKLADARKRLDAFAHAAAREANVHLEVRQLTDLLPVPFAPDIVDMVEAYASAHGYKARRMPSGAGHDAQMIARVAPSGMIFVPSVGGISHNVREFTKPDDLKAGLQVLESVALRLAMQN